MEEPGRPLDGHKMPVLEPGRWEVPQQTSPYAYVVRLILALPFFLAVSYLADQYGVLNWLVLFAEAGLVAIGCTVVLGKDRGLSLAIYLAGSAVLAMIFYGALMTGFFGGHQ